VLALAVALALAARGDRSPGAATGPTPTATPTSTPKPSATPAPLAVTAKVTRRIEDVADRPGGIALAGGDLWISSSRQPYLTRVVEATGRKRAHHPKVGTDVAAIVAYGGDVWVALGSNREVVRLNGETGRVRKRYAVPGDARRLAIERHGVWVSTRSNAGIPGYIFQLDRRTGRLLDTLQVNEGVGGLLAAAGAVWYVKRDSAKLARLEPGDETGEDFTTLTAPARSMRYGNGSIFVVTESEDTVMRVDVDGRGQVTGTAGHSPAQALYAGGFVWVASRNDHKVYVLDPETLQEVAKPIPVGLNPIGMVARGSAIWVIGTGDNSLTRIDYR
jgi:YVTN family beta-propeller protein